MVPNEKSCKLIGFGPGWGRRDYRQFEDIFVFHDVIANLKLIIDMLKVTSYKNTHTCNVRSFFLFVLLIDETSSKCSPPKKNQSFLAYDRVLFLREEEYCINRSHECYRKQEPIYVSSPFG